MKRVWQELRAGRSRVEGHQFFRWLNSEAVPLERRFVFSPVMIDFIMGFADLNKWFLSYAEPKNELERAINEHTEEDLQRGRRRRALAQQRAAHTLGALARAFGIGGCGARAAEHSRAH